MRLMVSNYLSTRAILQLSPIIPVVNFSEVQQAIAVVEAIQASGVKIIELTLRHKNSLPILQELTTRFTDMHIGVGTVMQPQQLEQVQAAGAQFAFSPAVNVTLLQEATRLGFPFIPAVTTFSEVLLAVEHGYSALKFFPAVLSGGVPLLKAWQSLQADVVFCPTGGVNASNYLDFLQLPSVACVGGSWLTARPDSNYQQITDDFRAAVAAVNQA